MRPIHPLAVLLFSLALALPALAKEESKLMVRMDKLGGGSARGDVRTQMSAGSAILHLKARGLDPALEHALYSDASPDGDDGAELARFTPAGNGSVNLRVDLLALGLGSDADPRGKRLSVHDGSQDVLEVWLLGEGNPKPKWLHAKEWTDLPPGEDNADEKGSVGARYQTNPSGKGRLLLAFRNAPEGSYSVYVDDALIAEDVVPNSGGNAQVSFRTSSKGKARSKPHNKKLAMGFDPYLAEIEVRQGDDVWFAGILAAQVEGLNDCDPASDALTALQGGDHAGTLTSDPDGTCEAVLEVEISGTGLPASLDVYIDEVFVGSFAAPGSAEFDNPAGSGAAVRIDDGAGMPTDYFSGSAP